MAALFVSVLGEKTGLIASGDFITLRNITPRAHADVPPPPPGGDGGWQGDGPGAADGNSSPSGPGCIGSDAAASASVGDSSGDGSGDGGY